MRSYIVPLVSLVPLVVAAGLLVWWAVFRIRIGLAGMRAHRELLAQDMHYRQLTDLALRDNADPEPSGFYEEQRQLRLLSHLLDRGSLTHKEYDRAARWVDSRCGGAEG